MGALKPIPVTPTRPDPATIDMRNVAFDYDRRSDIFTLHLFGRGQPAKVLHTGKVIDLGLDPTTHVIVGFQIEGYLAQAVYRLPYLLALAELAGTPQEEVATIRQRVARDDERWKRALVESLFEQAAPLSA